VSKSADTEVDLLEPFLGLPVYEVVRSFPPDMRRAASRKLQYLNAALKLSDLRMLPGNKLEALKGNGAGAMRSGSMTNGASSFNGPTAALKTFRSSTITKAIMRSKNPLHPGEVLLEEFLVPRAMSQRAFAGELGWTVARLNELIKGKRGISADSALDLAAALGTTPEVWMNLQAAYDLHAAEKRRKRAS
jgi:addiction module HigA family antidote